MRRALCAGQRHLHRQQAQPGRAAQVDPIKHTLKAPGAKRLKLKYTKPLSKFIQFRFRIQLAPLPPGGAVDEGAGHAEGGELLLRKLCGAEAGTDV
jgi:hypothetical protein